MLFKEIISLTLFLFSFSFLHSQDIRVVPAFVQLKMMDKNLSGSFEVTNLKNESQRFRVKVTHWTLDENNQILETEPTFHSIIQWIKFNPKEFSIGPSQSRKVRYTILKPKDKLNGEYWGGIEFEPLDQKKIRAKSNDPQTQSTATITVLTAFLVPIFVEMGNIDRQGSLENIQIYQDSVNYIIGYNIKNLGNAALRLDGIYEIYNDANIKNTGGKIGPVFVLPGSKILYRVRMNGVLKPGVYSITARFEDRSKSLTFSGSGKFTIKSKRFVKKNSAIQ